MEIKVETKSIFYGIMVYWEKVTDAACYTVNLYTKKQKWKIATIVVERNMCYYTFKDLGIQEYLIEVEAENREGHLIAQSKLVDCEPNRYVYTGLLK